MHAKTYFEDIQDAAEEFKEPPGLMIYRELMLVMNFMEPERCGLVMQGVFENVLHGYSAKSMLMDEREVDVMNRILAKYAENVAEYQEICRRNKENSRKAAEARARKKARTQSA